MATDEGHTLTAAKADEKRRIEVTVSPGNNPEGSKTVANYLEKR